MGERLDANDTMPSGLQEYRSRYGWHFSKKLCDWAVKRMRRENKATGKKEPIEPVTKQVVDETLRRYGIQLDNDKGYDAVYVFNMGKADYLKSSVPDEQHLAMLVKDYLDDPDGYEGVALTRFYADCIGSGTPIMWEEML